MALEPSVLIFDARIHANPDGHHIAAAAIAAGALVVLTWILHDLPAKELKKHGLVRPTGVRLRFAGQGAWH
jgi:hypothetical protein